MKTLAEAFENIPENVLDILNRLTAAGYEAYIVGGCVRDCLLGRMPSDWDVTTSALPAQVKSIFKRTVDTGIQHGTVTVLYRKDGKTEGYEVTTYRIDGVYEDARHPKSVTFTERLQEDLQRRDFTINAMAYHPEKGLADPFHGYEDLQAKIIRAVGEPEKRFGEDALRMMRAIRFSAQLDYAIEEATWEAIRRLCDSIRHVSAERIRTEMEKLLISEHPMKFRLFYESGLTAQFLPEWDVCMETAQETPHHCYTVGEHILHSLELLNLQRLKDETSPEQYKKELRYLRLALLLHDIAKPLCKTVDAEGVAHFKGHQEKGKELAREILLRLRYDNDTVDMVTGLVGAHEYRWEPEPAVLRRVIYEVGERFFPLLFYLGEADTLAQSTYMREEKLAKTRDLWKLWEEITEKKQCVSLKTLALTGNDLIKEGMKPGQEMGALLKEMLYDVLEEPLHNNKGYLLDRYVKGHL